jgi:hypothetical protein
MTNSDVARGIDRIIDNLRAEVGKYATEAGKYEAMADRAQSETAALRVDRERLQRRVNELEALKCANPCCQLHQVN